jgi:hypothetical protein
VANARAVSCNGSNQEFANFDHFKETVSQAKVVLGDAGDVECTYTIPKQDGTGASLSLQYADGGHLG